MIHEKRQIRLLVTGAPYFVKQTCEIAFSSPPWKSVTPNLAPLRRWRLRFLKFQLQKMHADGWYHIGGHTLPFLYKLKLFNQRSLIRTPIIIRWIGSDILTMAKEFEQKPGLFAAARQLTHFAGAPWLVQELKAIGLEAAFVPSSSKKRALYLSLEPPPLPKQFAILAYVPDQGEELYGWQHLIRLARELPETEIKILSGTGKSLSEVPHNIHFLGWHEDVYDAYKKCSLVVRMTNHDGYSSSVQEALLLGRHVIWTYPFPGVVQAESYDALYQHVKRLLDLHANGQLKINNEGRDFMAKKMNPDHLVAQMQKMILEVVESKRR